MDKNRKKYQVKLESELLTSAPHHKGICVVGGCTGKTVHSKDKSICTDYLYFLKDGIFLEKNSPVHCTYMCMSTNITLAFAGTFGKQAG